MERQVWTTRMIESRKTEGGPNANRQAYLDAMGIPVWLLRETTAIESPVVDCDLSLKLGPGSGGILLICAMDTDSAGKLANDISRSLGSTPVWSWPDAGEDAVTPALAVDKNLFTTIAVFGAELAERFFGSSLPASLNSASLVLLPSMQDPETCTQARQTLWIDLCRAGMVSDN